MLVLMVAPVDEVTDPLARGLERGEAGLGKVRHVFAGPEQRFDEGVVVADPRSAERGGDPELAEHDLHRLAFYRTAVVTVKHQRLSGAALLPDGALDQVAGVHGTLVLVHFPAHDLAAEQVQDQVQEEEAAADGGWQPGDVPAPNGVGCIGAMSGRRPGHSGWLGAAAMMLLVLVIQYTVKARLRGQVAAFISQLRHDLARRHGGVLGLVADRHDGLPLLITQGVRRQRTNRLRPPVGTDTATRRPALVGARRDAQNPASGLQAGAGGASLVDQLNSIVAIRGADHSSSPSPQIARAFFDKVSKAAVSASAFSLRASSRSSSRVRRRCSRSALICWAPRSSAQSLACSQARRQAASCSGYRPRLRQYSERSDSFIGAVSITAANLSRALQPWASDPASGYSSPRSRACLRQLYRVASDTPSSAATSRTDRLCGGQSLASTARLRSSEYFTVSSCPPPLRDHFRGGDNYPARGGSPTSTTLNSGR